MSKKTNSPWDEEWNKLLEGVTPKLTKTKESIAEQTNRLNNVIKGLTKQEAKKLCKDIGIEKPKTHLSMVEKFKLEIKWRKEHPKLAKLQDIWWWIKYGIWSKVHDFFKYDIKAFIQRGKRGFSNRDTWGFDYYLAKVISEGIDKLIKDVHGHPCDLKNLKQWKTILKKISKTFKTEEKIINGELIYLPVKKYLDKDRKYWIKYTKENNKEWDKDDRVMTKKENKEYLEGWELFSKYFKNLWD